MKISKIMVFTSVLLLVGSLAFSQGRADTYTFVWSVAGETYGQCDGFQILCDGVALFRVMDRYDKDGQWTQTVDLVSIGEEVCYNSVDSEKAVSGGPGEVEVHRFDPDTGVVKASGLTFKIRIPGYGLIFSETGALVFQCDPYTFLNCNLVSNVGHNQFLDQDLAALCGYLD